MKDEKYWVQEPGLFAFTAAAFLGSGTSYLIAAYFLGLSPAWFAIVAGFICGVVGLFLGENIGDAIVFSFVLGLMVYIFIKVGPEIEIIRAGVVSITTGLSVGKLVYGFWKEITGISFN